jgi:hypothetical protein
MELHDVREFRYARIGRSIDLRALAKGVGAV